MIADGRIDAAGPVMFVRVHDLGIQLLAHAVQSLKLVVAARAGIVQHARQRVRVVRRELCVDLLARGKRGARASEIGHVGMRLTCKHRIAIDALFLRPFDLAVPVGAFDEAHRNSSADLTCEFLDESHRVAPAPLIRLYGEAESIPTVESLIAIDALEYFQPQLEAVRLLGVDRQADADFSRVLCKSVHRRHQFGHHTCFVRVFVAGVQS